jgi:hypothetical protein
LAVTGSAPPIRRDTRSYTRETSTDAIPPPARALALPASKGRGRMVTANRDQVRQLNGRRVSRDAPGLRDPDKQRPPREAASRRWSERGHTPRPRKRQHRCPRPGQRTEGDSGTGHQDAGTFYGLRNPPVSRDSKCARGPTPPNKSEHAFSSVRSCSVTKSSVGFQSSQRHRSRSRRPLESNLRPSFSSNRRWRASPPLRDRL